jgi:hypothetical protein
MMAAKRTPPSVRICVALSFLFGCARPIALELPPEAQSGLLVIEDTPGNFRGLLFSVEEGPAAMALTAGSDEPYAVSVLPLPCPPSIYGIPAGERQLFRSTEEIAGFRQLPSPVHYWAAAPNAWPIQGVDSSTLDELWVEQSSGWRIIELSNEQRRFGLGAPDTTRVVAASDGEAVLAVARGSTGSVLVSPGGASYFNLANLWGSGRYARALTTVPPPTALDNRIRFAVLTGGSATSTLAPRIDILARRTTGSFGLQLLDDERLEVRSKTDAGPFSDFDPRFLATGLSGRFLLVGRGSGETTRYTILDETGWANPVSLPDLRFDPDHLTLASVRGGWLVAASGQNLGYEIGDNGVVSPILSLAAVASNDEGEAWSFFAEGSAWIPPPERGFVDAPRLGPGPALARRSILMVPQLAQAVVMEGKIGTCASARIYQSATPRTEIKAVEVGALGLVVVGVDVEGWFTRWATLDP